MKTLILATAGLLTLTGAATAQIRLPQASPSATLMQTVGTTDFTVKYARPSLRGRTPFTGDFVPYGKVWRTGANAATQFTTSTDVVVQGQRLPAGTYALLSIPTATEWTLIFSKNATVTEQSYKPDDDALRVTVRPTATAEPVETFTIGFGDLTDSTATMSLMWGPAKATANLLVETSALAAAGVDRAVAEKPDDPAVLQAAAAYNLQKGRNLNQALAWADKAIGMKETFRNVWLKAQLLAKMGQFAQALPLAQRALSLGETSNDPAFPFFKEAIQKGIGEYTTRMPPVLPGKGKRKRA